MDSEILVHPPEFSICPHHATHATLSAVGVFPPFRLILTMIALPDATARAARNIWTGRVQNPLIDRTCNSFSACSSKGNRENELLAR